MQDRQERDTARVGEQPAERPEDPVEQRIDGLPAEEPLAPGDHAAEDPAYLAGRATTMEELWSQYRPAGRRPEP